MPQRVGPGRLATRRPESKDSGAPAGGQTPETPRILDIHPVQVVQRGYEDPDEPIPMIEGKRTMFRVFVSVPPGWTDNPGRLAPDGERAFNFTLSEGERRGIEMPPSLTAEARLLVDGTQVARRVEVAGRDFPVRPGPTVRVKVVFLTHGVRPDRRERDERRRRGAIGQTPGEGIDRLRDLPFRGDEFGPPYPPEGRPVAARPRRRVPNARDSPARRPASAWRIGPPPPELSAPCPLVG